VESELELLNEIDVERAKEVVCQYDQIERKRAQVAQLNEQCQQAKQLS